MGQWLYWDNCHRIITFFLIELHLIIVVKLLMFNSCVYCIRLWEWKKIRVQKGHVRCDIRFQYRIPVRFIVKKVHWPKCTDEGVNYLKNMLSKSWRTNKVMIVWKITKINVVLEDFDITDFVYDVPYLKARTKVWEICPLFTLRSNTDTGQKFSNILYELKLFEYLHESLYECMVYSSN